MTNQNAKKVFPGLSFPVCHEDVLLARSIYRMSDKTRRELDTLALVRSLADAQAAAREYRTARPCEARQARLTEARDLARDAAGRRIADAMLATLFNNP